MKRFLCALLAAAILIGCCPALAEDAAPAAEEAEYEVPEVIQEAIRIGIAEWEALGEQRLSQDPKGNKFTKWWGYACGWCGAFANYCLDTAGVPLEPPDTYRKVKPHEGGVPYGIREAHQSKIFTGFKNMERITDIPRPGYLVLYGARDIASARESSLVHVGLVTDVIDRGDGLYQVFTVEGNIGSTIKRYTYLYDSTADGKHNLSLLPESEWAEPEIYHYDEPRQTKRDGKIYGWYVDCFCQTWQ